ncbi:MAG: hypothetical protein ABII00_13435, partial [Elusimicrobiota bacterium]
MNPSSALFKNCLVLSLAAHAAFWFLIGRFGHLAPPLPPLPIEIDLTKPFVLARPGPARAPQSAAAPPTTGASAPTKVSAPPEVPTPAPTPPRPVEVPPEPPPAPDSFGERARPAPPAAVPVGEA